ncbi:DUF2399 domain-containing protein [Streptomyces cellulosae]
MDHALEGTPERLPDRLRGPPDPEQHLTPQRPRSAVKLTHTSAAPVDHALLQLAADQGLRLRYAGDLDTASFHVAATVQQTYGAELDAMNADVVHAAGDSPSAVPLGILPAGCDPQLGAGGGHVLCQEHDAVLARPFASKPSGQSMSARS